MSQSKPVNEPRNHHHIPRLYLRGFASVEDKTHIWVYWRNRIFLPNRRNPNLVAIKRAGVIRDFYAYTKRDGSPDYGSVEANLEKHETKHAELLKKLCMGRRLTDAERADFTQFILLMHMRTKRRQSDLPTLWKNVLSREGFFEDLVSGLEEERGRELNEQEREFMRQEIARRQSEMPDEIKASTMFNSFPQSAPVIAGMRWSVLAAPINHFFIASDNPVILYKGVGHPDGKILLPLSSRVALLISHEPLFGHGITHIDAGLVSKINIDTCTNASDEVYARQGNPDLVRMFNESQSSQ